MNEGIPQNKVDLPKTPNESLGDKNIDEVKLREWLDFANTQFAKIWLSAKAERGRILSLITEELTGKPNVSFQQDLEQYDLLTNEQVSEEVYKSSPQLRLFLSHYLGGLKRYLDSASKYEEDKEKVELLTSSAENMFNQILETDLRHATKGFMDKEDFPSSPYQSEQELLEKMMSMIQRKID